MQCRECNEQTNKNVARLEVRVRVGGTRQRFHDPALGEGGNDCGVVGYHISDQRDTSVEAVLPNHLGPHLDDPNEEEPQRGVSGAEFFVQIDSHVNLLSLERESQQREHRR